MGTFVHIVLPVADIVLALGIVAALALSLAVGESIKARQEGRHWFTGRPQ